MLGAFTYGVREGQIDDSQFALAYGLLGLGVEKLSSGTDRYNRFSAALGFPLAPRWYGGLRYRTTRSDVSALDHLDNIDVGLQFRPHPKLALGLTGSQLNRPNAPGEESPILFSLGATVRPVERIDLSFDVRSPYRDFAKHFGYQGIVAVEVARGISLRAAYDDEIKFQAGLQVSFGPASLYSVAETASGRQGLLTGVQVTATPYPTVIAPAQSYKMEVGAGLRETPTHGGLFGKDRPSLLHVLRNLERAEKNPNVDLVIVKLPEFPLGLAAAQEVNEALWRVRNAGKQVEVFLTNAGIKNIDRVGRAEDSPRADGRVAADGSQKRALLFEGDARQGRRRGRISREGRI